MENKNKVDFNIGDLVKLKTTFSARLAHPHETPDLLGFGIVVEKITELHTLIDNKIPIFEYEIETDYIRDVNNKKIKSIKHTIPTKICRVYWLNIKRYRWEYENDIETAWTETSNP